MKKSNKIKPKLIGDKKPITQKEKLDRLQKINPSMRDFIELFDLEVSL